MKKLLTSTAVTAAFCVPLCIGNAMAAENYPSREISLVVPAPPGGTTDVVGRVLGKYLSQELGQPVIVMNRPGASSVLGTQAVMRAPKDGYNLLLMAGSLHSFAPAFYVKMPFDPIEDIQPISRVAAYPFALVTAANQPYNSVQDLVNAAKSGKQVSYGSFGEGSSPHLLGEWLKLQGKFDATHIPYKGGGQAATDLLGGQISVIFQTLPAAVGQIQSKQVKALAITSAKRDPLFPNVPAMAEIFPGFTADSWLGLAVAKGTPKPVVDKLSAAVRKVSANPEYIENIKKLGADVTTDSSPEQFHTFMVKEKAKWNMVIDQAKIKRLPSFGE